MSDQSVGFEPDEVRTRVSTRSARLKWVVVVDRDIPAGRIVNAAACVAAATAPAVTGLLGPGGADGDGSPHSGLPWAGCSVLAADAETLRAARAEAAAQEGVLVTDMPTAAQEVRVYDDYLARLADLSAEEVAYAAVSLVGPRKKVDRIVGGLGLLP
ncbi:DUF2000 domain-containing protein [Saccharopolyspora griseoalba]|uniref:DUF2000 domain-containing protein n=1 Tax=Saccharopolyspora griseoalba TaxID=1431848 RepID=A0ABW2LMH0_9PSEU